MPRKKASPAPATTEPAADPIDLGTELRIAQAAALHARVQSHVAPGAAPLVFDAGQLTKVDTAGLQALAAGCMALRAAGRAWRWHNPPLVLAQSAAALGLARVLELP